MIPFLFKAVVLFLFFICTKPVFSSNYLLSFCTDSVLESLIPESASFMPIPSANDDFWRLSIPSEIQKDYIKAGYNYLGKSWNTIPPHLFEEYRINGNRSNYESRYFESRRQLSFLLMAETMDYKGAFLDDIIRGIHYFLSESWWGVPAHYPLQKPSDSIQVVDLFNAETANLLTWTVYMLGDKLDKKESGISEIIKQELNRRFLVPARINDSFWKEGDNNWNPWICSNWLACVLLYEKDRKNQIEALKQILRSLNSFYEKYPSDGGCVEGILYWNRAAASFFECLRLLEIATNGTISMRNDDKLLKMSQFISNMYIGNRYFVNFADSAPQPFINPQILMPFAQYVNDSTLMGFAKYLMNSCDYQHNPSSLYNKCSNFPSFSRELFFLVNYGNVCNIQPLESYNRGVFLPESQIFVARSSTIKGKELYVAAKGGNNFESHNHNDVGSFVVYDKGTPVIIDIGKGTYTANYFSSDRYNIFNCRSAYHNLPIINGFEQRPGAEYKASDLNYVKKNNYASISMNISGAYSKKASVRKWERTIELRRGKYVKVTENFQLDQRIDTSAIVIVCLGVPQNKGKGIITITSQGSVHKIKFNQKQITPEIEKIKHDDPYIHKIWNNQDLYRIKFNIQSTKLKDIICYKMF